MASFWERLGWRSGRTERMDTLELFREVFGMAPAWSGKDVSLTTALQVSTALACGRVIAEGLAMLPWKLLQQRGRSIEPALKHPLYDKLSTSPNSLQTAFEFQETMGLHLAFCHNAYVWAPTVRGRIDEMYLFEPGWVTTKYQWPDPPKYEIRLDGGRKIEMTPADLWHIRGPSWCSYVGMDYLKLARQALGLAMALEEGQARLQAQGVSMPGYLSVEGTLTDEQHKKLTKWLEERHQGAQNSGRPMVLDKAAKFMSAAMTNTDAQALEQRKFSVEEVCRSMRVLPIMVGHADKTATYASAEQMFLAHAMYTTGPWARRLEQSADKRLLSPDERQQGYYTKLNEKALLRMSTKDQMEYLARGVLSGIIVRNEGRAALDMNPIEGLDEPLAPANTFVGNPPDSAPTPKPASEEPSP